MSASGSLCTPLLTKVHRLKRNCGRSRERRVAGASSCVRHSDPSSHIQQPTSTLISTTDILDRLRLPISSAVFDRICDASMTASSGVLGCVASCSRFLKSQVLVVLIPPPEVPEPVEAFRTESQEGANTKWSPEVVFKDQLENVDSDSWSDPFCVREVPSHGCLEPPSPNLAGCPQPSSQ
ncbi:uncharacterized protein PGTG_18644 [Puccinia graminis f. sp. tritici CRL 75-36-700-3]|uniref:Uncharacterized protein n=1 Tax=Puccinia graminis f. sp. tritici (strain CRL 75-36-700-3 / race SCCL) TaxID=418459 RepID=E3L885_PUCGT|nr:uncharacterized protein PGTG_18644 [Puccinia graminis f. sp. tritici CRL 75-36-700-3]EFP92760.1 hypothetical protein PGTG_18644 [Puccinia graminis f. sp. tritici CRL 75-36-700-3]